MNIVITGASRGVGRKLAEIYVTEGHQVYSIARNPGASPDEHGESLHFYAGDVAVESDVAAFADFCRERAGSIDLVINNAAVHLEQSQNDVLDLDMSVYEPSFRINAMGPLMIAKYFLPLMGASSKPLFVSISSEAGSIGDCWRKSEFSYCMSKAALNMAMKILQNRVREQGIKVLLVHPGWVQTDMGGANADLRPEESAESMYRNLLTRDWSLDEPMYFNWLGKELSW